MQGTRIFTLALVSLFISLSISLQVYAWGPVGHCAVGLIADANLSPTAKREVKKILVNSSLAGVANWADSIKSGGLYRQTTWYHFEKMPDNIRFIDHLRSLPDWQKQKGGVMEAILVSQDILRRPTATPTEVRDALAFLVHFVGDLHQPLHSGRPDDNGGVKINVSWFGTPSNLHRIWDSGMIITGHSELFPQQASLEQACVNYANFLVRRPSIPPFSVETDFNSWLMESMVLRPASYNRIYQTNQPLYQQLHLPEVDQRIFVAGLRLAKLLNDIYAQQAPPSVVMDLWKQVEAIVGSLEKVISLKP